jgi:hypothetical protein
MAEVLKPINDRQLRSINHEPYHTKPGSLFSLMSRLSAGSARELQLQLATCAGSLKQRAFKSNESAKTRLNVFVRIGVPCNAMQ